MPLSESHEQAKKYLCGLLIERERREQAWSTGTPLFLIRTMPGLEPISDHLLVDPAVRSMIGQLEVLDIPGCRDRQNASSRGKQDILEAHRSAQRGFYKQALLLPHT